MPTLSVSQPHSQTANVGTLVAGFQHFEAFAPQTADFHPFALSMMRGVFANCPLWQFNGCFSAPIKSGHFIQPADLGSFMAIFA